MKKGFFQFALAALYCLTAQAQEIKNVNFTQEGEVSKLIIEVDKDVVAERFHVTEDKQIILDLKNTKSSPKLLRGIDTSEFPGSVVYISGYKKPGSANDVRFAIQLRDNVRSVLDIKDNKIVLNVENRFGVFSKSKLKGEEPQGASLSNGTSDSVGLNVPKSASIEDILDNLTLSGPKKYIGKRISINVKQIPVREIINMIAETSGFNIIQDNAIETLPPLTLTLTNVPWDQALDTVMSLSRLVATKNANILVIKTLDQVNKERELEMRAESLKQVAEPMVTRVFAINYATLSEIEKIVRDYLTPIRQVASNDPTANSSRASLQTDERTNSLIVKDTVESIERIKKIIETLDTQTPQILIEAKIVEANDGYQRRLGLNRGLTFGYDALRNQQTTPGDISEATVPGFSFSTAPTADAPTIAGATIAVYKRLIGLNFNLELMESESKGRIISSPRVVTQNKKAATITSTEQTSYRVQQNATTTQPALSTFQNLSATLNLTVTPQVTNDGAISMAINLTKSAFGTRAYADGPPNLNTRSVNTNVLVDNGSTVVIGGLYSDSTSTAQSGIPVLKDLPLIGWLFRTSNQKQTDRAELIIFMTPRILNQEEAGFSQRAANKAPDTNAGL